MAPANAYIVIGKVIGLFGVRGGIKVFSYTVPRESIDQYAFWCLGEERTRVIVAAVRRHGNNIIANLVGIDTRDQASLILQQDIAVKKSQLEVLPDNEYYWYQLLGLKVVNMAGISLGQVKSLFATGANDVLVVNEDDKERLIPYIYNQYIKEIDLEHKIIKVDWQVDW